MAEKSGDNPGRSEGKVRCLKRDNDNIKAAVEGVSSDEMTISAASKVFKVPRKILDDRIRGNVSHGKKPERWSNPSPGPLQSVQVTMPGLVQSKVPVNIGGNYLENDIPTLYSTVSSVHRLKHLMK